MVGHIKLDRKILKWEWYDDANTFRLFIHLLLNANHKPQKWHGININRGQVLTGRLKLASALNLSEMQIRYSLNRLKSTNEITIKVTNKFSLITICKYDTYQSNDKEINQQNIQHYNQPITNKQPTSNQQVTTNNNDNNDNNEKNDNNITELSKIEKSQIYSPEIFPTWGLEVSKFLKDEIFKKSFCAAKKIEYSELSKKMNEFVIDLNLKQDYKNVAALKRHFTNSYQKYHENKVPKISSQAFIEVPQGIDYENSNGW